MPAPIDPNGLGGPVAARPVRVVTGTVETDEAGRAVSVLPIRYVSGLLDSAMGITQPVQLVEVVTGLLAEDELGRPVSVQPVRVVEANFTTNEVGQRVAVVPVRVFGATINISASSVLESASIGSTVGVLSVAGGSGSYTFTKTADLDSKFAVSGANLNLAAGLNFESAQSHSVTISASNGVDAPVVRTLTISVTNVFEQPSLGALSIPSSVSRNTTANITGATAGSAITGTMPTGWTLNGAARTIAIAADAPTGAQSWSLIETLADSANSPRTSTGSSSVSAAEPDGYDVILLAGQSNMVGRYGPVDGVLDATDARILQVGASNATLRLASDPLDHTDEQANTVGLGMSFAKAYLATLPANRSIILVPVGNGGTGFSNSYWTPGGTGDLQAISRANTAMSQVYGAGAVNRMAAILWHQGEADTSLSQATYSYNLDYLIDRWRQAITGAANTPFVCGGTLVGGAQTNANIQAALADTVNRLPFCGFAAATGLTSGGDNLHFDAASLRTFGGRYHTEFAAARTRTISQAVPGAVADLTGTPSNGAMGLTWTAPAPNGGFIRDYVVEYKASASGTWLTFDDLVRVTTGATVTGLTNGTSYDFRVRAVNSVGTGAASNVFTATPVNTSVAALAQRNYTFGTDNASMTDTVAGNSLVPASGALTNSSNYVTTAGQLGGARSDIAVSNTMTMVFVARVPIAANGFIGGATGATGASIFRQGTTLRYQLQGGAQNSIAYTFGQWRFLALSIQAGTRRVDYFGQSGGATVIQDPATSTAFGSVGTGLLGIGDTYLNSASFAAVADIAKFMIFNTSLTKAQLDILYGEVVTEMAGRGITVL